MEFLGFLINSTTVQIQMPQKKLRKIQHDARWLLQHQSITVWDLACFVGKTTASSKAIWQALQGNPALMNSAFPEAEDNSVLASRFNIRLPLSEEAQQDLHWQVSLDQTLPLQDPLLPRVPNMTITSDASNTGWGACQGDITTGGTWSAQEMMHYINYLKLLAVFLASEGREQYDHPVPSVVLGPPSLETWAEHLQILHKVCNDLGVPLVPGEQEGSNTTIIFLGIPIDAIKQG